MSIVYSTKYRDLLASPMHICKGRDWIAGTLQPFVISTLIPFSLFVVSGGVHEMVPQEIREEAERLAKEALKDSDSEDDD